MGITYLIGDAAAPVGNGRKAIVHVCNDEGLWLTGFANAISERWESPELKYEQWAKRRPTLPLGGLQYVPVEPDITVINMIAQHKRRVDPNSPPAIRYDILRKCLGIVAGFALGAQASIHMPRIGCGRAGGSWDQVLPIIEETLIGPWDLPVYVYDLPKGPTEQI